MTDNKNNINKSMTTSNYSTRKCDNVQIGKPSLLCLNDDVLIHVFSFLDLADSIHLSDTCSRLNNLSCWEFKKYVELDTKKYLNEGSIPIHKLIYSIGPHVQVLKARLSQIKNCDMSGCLNVKSLQILGSLNDYVDLSKLNRSILELNQGSLWLVNYSSKTEIFNKLFNGVTNLKELRIDDQNIDCCEIISRNVNIERLSLQVHKNIKDTFNFEIFSNLQHLKLLHLRLPGTKYLNVMTRFGNFNGLTEFSLYCNTRWSRSSFNTFLKYLAEHTKLDKLRVFNGKINDDTFTTMKLMNLSALSLCCNYNTNIFKIYIREYSAPQLKHLQLWGCSMQEFVILVEYWTNLETICLYMKNDYKNLLYEAFIIEGIVKLSTDRPMLRIHVDSYKVHNDPQLPCIIEVSFCYSEAIYD